MLNDRVDEVRAWLGNGRRAIKLFWSALESARMLKFFDWHPSVQAAVEAGILKRIRDPEFIKPLVCHSIVAPCRPSAVPRMGHLVALAAGFHALATVGGRAAAVVWAEAHGARKYASEELPSSGEGSADSDNYVGD